MTGMMFLGALAAVFVVAWVVFLILLPLTNRTSIRYASTGGHAPRPVPMGCMVTIAAIMTTPAISHRHATSQKTGPRCSGKCLTRGLESATLTKIPAVSPIKNRAEFPSPS